ncbi:MAG: DUF6441 family protein [Rhodospirillales bacterium]|nr:DUF6441 family protein [Rhodospirillales bacterium]
MPTFSRLVRNVPGPELHDYLTGIGMTFPKAVNWNGESSEIAPLVQNAFDIMSEAEKERLRHELDRIDRMTTEVGQTAIMSVATQAQFNRLKNMGTRHERALWFLRNDLGRFRLAEDVAFFENARRGRTWDGFLAPKGLTVARGEIRRDQLAEAIRKLFHEGEKVKVEIFDRTRPDLDGGAKELVQVTIYREGNPDSVEIFKNKDDIVPLVFRPVYEIGFTYEAATGVIEVVGDRKIERRDLAKVFAKTLLNHSIDAAPLPLRHYDLSVFMHDRHFPTDPKDRIGRVRVRLVKFENLDESAFLTIEARTQDDNVHTLAEQMFEERNPFLGGYRRRGPSLLVAENQRARAGKRGGFAKASASTLKSGRGLASVPMFILVPQVSIRKRLDVVDAANKWLAVLPGLVIRNWREPGR